MSLPDNRFPYTIQGWDTADDHFDINIRANGVHFSIKVSADSFVNSPVAQEQFRDILDKLATERNGESQVWQYSQRLADHFTPEFEQLAPQTSHTGKLTLADLTARDHYEAHYRVEDEAPIHVKFIKYSPETVAFAKWNVHSLQSTFPVFSPGEVEIPYDGHSGKAAVETVPHRVIVNGVDCFYKSCWLPFHRIPEIRKRSKIESAGNSDRLSMSRLYGIVADKDGQTKGLLYHWIQTLSSGTLTFSLTPDTPMQQREQWATQIQKTVDEFHRLGVVWGDVKSDNVLIDSENNALVIDLEGGTTGGWVDREVGGTVEGDLQGMERLRDFIFNDKSSLRPIQA